MLQQIACNINFDKPKYNIKDIKNIYKKASYSKSQVRFKTLILIKIRLGF